MTKRKIISTIALTFLFAFGAGGMQETQMLLGLNILDGKNPGCEGGAGLWTSTGGTVTANTSTPLWGSGSCRWDASAGSQLFESALVNIPEALKSRSCVAKFMYKGADANLVASVRDGAGSLVGSASVTLATSAATTFQTLTFTCPASGALKLRFASTANAALLDIDGVFIGSDERASATVSSLIGTATWAATANCSWENQTTGAMNTFALDSDCPNPTVTGSVSAPGTKIPAAVVSSAAAGNYRVCFSGPILVDAATGAGDETCQFQLTDGTRTGGIIEVNQDSVTYEPLGYYCGILENVPSGSATFQLQTRVWSDGGTATKCIIRPDTAGTDTRPTNTPFTITVEKI